MRVLHEIAINRAPRLSEVLFEKPNHTFASLAALPSNVEAVEASLLFSAGLNPFVALVGPSGWGKSHLLEAVSFRLASERETPIEPVSALAYLANGPRPDPSGPLLIDDAQEALSKPKYRMLLRVELERRVRAGRSTMLAFTMPKITRNLRAFLPSGRDWSVSGIEVPEPPERMLLLNQMSSAEGLALSPSLVRIIAMQMYGNGRTLAGALKRLRLSSLTWLDSRATLRACGLLDPFFADNSSWDLKHKILRIAEAGRVQFGQVSVVDLAVYTMLREACLSEIDVARAMNMEPADVYLRASRFQKEMERNETAAHYVSQCVSMVVDSLATD